MEESVNHRGCVLQNTSLWWSAVQACYCEGWKIAVHFHTSFAWHIHGDGSTHCLVENIFGFIQLYCKSKVGTVTGSSISCYAEILFTSWL